MKKIIIILILITNGYLMGQTKIKVGDSVPDFTLLDQTGNAFSVQKHLGSKHIVIYFYPKDDTPGCRKEACKFRDDFEHFTDLNALVIGISGDDVKSHQKFKTKYNLPFTLLADTNNTVRKLFGVPKSMGFIPGRVTYIVNKSGKIVYIFNSMSNAEKHVEEALTILKTMSD